MMTPSVIKVGSTLTIHMAGKMYTIDKTVKNYDLILDIVKTRKWDELQTQLDIATMVATRSNGKAEVVGDKVLLGGVEVKQVISDRIIEMLSEGWDVEPMLRFLENVGKNPAEFAIKEMYLFLETNRLPLTEDGCFLAYKVVDRDYMDCHSRTVRNRIGDKPGRDKGTEMTREDVDPNRNNTCSRGYHFCSLGYIDHFASGDNRLMLVKVNPADVVSIPADYQNTKGRCWTYEVVDEINRGHKQEIDRTAPAVVPAEAMPDRHVATSTETRVLNVFSEQLAIDISMLHMGVKIDEWLLRDKNHEWAFDSLDVVEIQMALDEEFCESGLNTMDMEAEELKKLFHTLGDVVRWIDVQIGNKVAPEPEQPKTNLISRTKDSDVAKTEHIKASINQEADKFAKFLASCQTTPATGEMLKNLREECNVTGSALAAELGVSRSSVWSFENSLKPKAETVERACLALKVITERS